MEQHDYILRKITLLRTLLNSILKLKGQNDPKCLELVQISFKEYIDIDIFEISEFSDEEFMRLLNRRGISNAEKKYVAEILESTSVVSRDPRIQKLIFKTLSIYENIQIETKSTYSMELNSKISKLKRKISQ